MPLEYIKGSVERSVGGLQFSIDIDTMGGTKVKNSGSNTEGENIVVGDPDRGSWERYLIPGAIIGAVLLMR